MRLKLGAMFIKPAPKRDFDKLCVRIDSKNKPDTIKWYDYVHIIIKGRKITCKLRGTDIPELKGMTYNQIYINEHLRGILRVSSDDEKTIYIEKASKWLMPCYFVLYHPDDVVKVSTWLAFLSVMLGLLSIFIAIFS